MSTLVTRAGPVLGLIAALLFSPAAALAQAQSYSGLIVSRDETELVVRIAGQDRTVKITPDTKIQSVAGSLGVRRKSHTIADLMRGLSIDVTATSDGEDLIAQDITFKPGSLRTAQQIEAGLVETEGRVSENADRIDNIGDLVAKDRAKVFFAVGKYEISADGQQTLKDIAAKAKATRGFRLAVVGRADPTGNAAANRRLSARRAEAVKAYLIESCGIMPGRIVPNTALGEDSVANDPDRPANDAEARRVTVTIMVSKSARP